MMQETESTMQFSVIELEILNITELSITRDMI